MRFLMIAVLLVAVVMVVADAFGFGGQYNRYRSMLRQVSCQDVQNSGICERCCDPCSGIECCEPLTCHMGMCKCNGNICGDDQTCTGTCDTAVCTDNCRDEDCTAPLTCDAAGECKCNGNVCGDYQTCTDNGGTVSCIDDCKEECTAPMTCHEGECKCNGNICGDYQTCKDNGGAVSCIDDCKDEDCTVPETCHKGECKCNGNICSPGDLCEVQDSNIVNCAG